MVETSEQTDSIDDTLRLSPTDRALNAIVFVMLMSVLAWAIVGVIMFYDAIMN